MTPNNGLTNGDQTESMEIRLGRRKTDVVIIVGWLTERGLVKCNVAFVKGIYLEEISTKLIPKQTIRDGTAPPQVIYEKIQMGIVLYQAKWGNVHYFMKEHDGWKEDDYFEAADLLIQERKQADKQFEAESE